MHLHDTMAELSKTRPVFHSEADFQHALAWEFHLAHPSASVRIERPVEIEDDTNHYDLLIEHEGRRLVIELKYKTRKADLLHAREHFRLSNQSAQDLGRYDFLRDIARVEQYVASHPGAEGYAVFLTHDPGYWEPAKRTETIDAAFRVHHLRKLQGELAWGPKASPGTIRGRENAIKLAGAYRLEWRDFSVIDDQRFRYLAVKVGGGRARSSKRGPAT